MVCAKRGRDNLCDGRATANLSVRVRWCEIAYLLVECVEPDQLKATTQQDLSGIYLYLESLCALRREFYTARYHTLSGVWQ